MPTLDIALLLMVGVSRLVKALSVFADLLTRRWHSLASQVHPFKLPILARDPMHFANLAKIANN
jgi:hypothetical protein